MLCHDHDSRYSLQEIYDHKWFRLTVKKPCTKSKAIAKKAKEESKESKVKKIRKLKAEKKWKVS